MIAANQLLILGVGSPFGADRAGWEAVRLLSPWSELKGVRAELVDRPGAGLLHLWQGVQAAILIDALVCDSPCGTLHRFGPELLAGNDRNSSHGFGVAEALALGRVIGALPRHLALVGISATGDEPPPIDPAVLIPMIETIAKEMGLASS